MFIMDNTTTTESGCMCQDKVTKSDKCCDKGKKEGSPDININVVVPNIFDSGNYRGGNPVNYNANSYSRDSSSQRRGGFLPVAQAHETLQPEITAIQPAAGKSITKYPKIFVPQPDEVGKIKYEPIFIKKKPKKYMKFYKEF